MISIKLQGGLCNQMFMAAFIYTYANKHGLKYDLPPTVINPHNPSKRVPYRFNGINYTIHPLPDRIVKEKRFSFDEYEKQDNVVFEGYFQSHKYFDEKKIQELLNFPWSDITDVCGIHVRRDDYLKWAEFHPPVTKDYIILAMDFMFAFFGITKFKFYSDDIPWCQANFFNQYGEYEIDYSYEQDELKDLVSLSNHQYLIGSNSAFSLWGHYLNRNDEKFAIFPEKWFGPKLPHDTKDLYPPKSIQL